MKKIFLALLILCSLGLPTFAQPKSDSRSEPVSVRESETSRAKLNDSAVATVALAQGVKQSSIAQARSEVVRVGISDSNFKSFVYNNVSVFGTSETFIYEKGKGLLRKVPAYQAIDIKMEDNVFNITDHKQLTGPLVIDCPDGLLGVKDLKRKGKQALYHGAFEVIKTNGNDKFCLVNLIEIEEYLKGVVPNEMPVRFGLEALKAQSIAARNYILSPRVKAFKEFDAGDSVASQVYFGANTEETLATQAIKETNSLVALYNWDLILAQYSSTAGGYTESFEFAFSDPKTKEFPSKSKPYLVARPDMIATAPLNREEEARRFYMSFPDAYDMKSPYYRWQRQWEKAELENVLAKTLIAQSSAGFVKPQFKQGDVFGKLKEINVKRRGDSGKIIEMEVVTDNQTYHVFKELVIRRLLPKDGISLPSANFVFENQYNDKGELSRIMIYGGGFGHGVGMSQYGAGFMGTSLNMPFDKILKHYYTGISIGTTPVIISSFSDQQIVSQTFYAPYKNASIIVNNKYDITDFKIKLNGCDMIFKLEKKINQIDISSYIKKGENTITFYYPMKEGDKKALRLYVEVVKADKDNVTR